MPNMNEVFIAGHLGHDAELKFTPNGLAIVNFSLALKETKKVNNQWVDQPPSWIDCVHIGEYAGRNSADLVKGAGVMVRGRLKQDKWQGSDGKTKSKVVVVVNQIVIAKPGERGGKHETPRQQELPHDRARMAAETVPEHVDGEIPNDPGAASGSDIPFAWLVAAVLIPLQGGIGFYAEGVHNMLGC